MTGHEKVKDILSAIFRRKGRNGIFTRLFEDLDSHQKEALLKLVDLSKNELPVIGSFETEGPWMLVTTKKIIWNYDGKINALKLKYISIIKADFHKLILTGHQKSGMRELIIFTINGEQHILKVEEGAPLSGVWNTLNFIGHRNRKFGGPI